MEPCPPPRRSASRSPTSRGSIAPATSSSSSGCGGGARRDGSSTPGSSRLAAEVKARSSLELGHDGLAQRSGMRTPDALVSSVTGTSGPEARALVAVGEMMDAPSPWLAEVASGVGAGDVSVGAAAAIQQGLGLAVRRCRRRRPGGCRPHPRGRGRDPAAREGGPPGTRTARPARRRRRRRPRGAAAREAVSPAHAASRRHDAASYGLLDPESAALVTDAIDLVTAPRRGGPRFVDPTQQGSRRRDRQRLPHHRTARPGCTGRDGAHRRRRRRGPRVRHPQARRPRARHRRRPRPSRRRRTPRRADRLRLGRDRRAASLRRRLPPDPVRRLRPRARPGTHAAALLREAAHRARRRSGADARSPDATDHPPGPKPTTPTNGTATTARPTSATASCSAGTTTCGCTTTAGESGDEAPSSGSNHHRATRSIASPCGSNRRIRCAEGAQREVAARAESRAARLQRAR